MKSKTVDVDGKLVYIKSLNLRHSFAFHLIKNKIDLRYIQEFLGYKSSKTTESYTNVSPKDFGAIESPFDSLLAGDEAWSLRGKGTIVVQRQFAYTSNLAVYPNGSDITELYEMAPLRNIWRYRKWKEKY